jgi:hypothetical protein
VQHASSLITTIICLLNSFKQRRSNARIANQISLFFQKMRQLQSNQSKLKDKLQFKLQILKRLSLQEKRAEGAQVKEYTLNNKRIPLLLQLLKKEQVHSRGRWSHLKNMTIAFK